MNPMKILLVDDSKSARYALRLQLQRHGMMVETCDAAESALERVRDTPPDAIFMDHTMPGMNGYEALDILKTNPSTAHIPVVMCTSNEDPEFIAQAKKKGALDILSKSTAPEKLGNLLARLEQAGASPEGISAPIGAEASDDGRLAEAAPGATDTSTEEPFEARVRTLIEPLMDERAERLAADLVAKIDDRIESHVRTSIGPLMEDLTKRLGEDLITKTNQKLVAGLEREGERLKQQVLEAQSEKAQLTASRLLNDVLPQALQQQREQEKQAMAQTVTELADEALSTLVAEPSFMQGVLDTLEERVTESAEQIAKRQATEIAETLASEQANTVAELLAQPSKTGDSNILLLSAGAALVGIASAAVVYLLLS